MTFDQWWTETQKPYHERRQFQDQTHKRSMELFDAITREAALLAWNARQLEIDRLRQALSEAISLTKVPDHCQDDEWRKGVERIEEVAKGEP